MEINIGDIFLSKNFDKFKINKLIGKDKNRRLVYEIEFLKTGYITNSTSQEVKSGEIKDYLTPNVCGIGYMGKPIKNYNKKLYTTWKNMISRCYDSSIPNYKRYGAKGTYVDERWHNFYNFINDIVFLDGWDENEFNLGHLELDKDIKQVNIANKVYSKDTCVWVEEYINKSFTKNTYNKIILGISPENKIHIFSNIDKFSKEHNLTSPNIIVCLKDNSKMHKGWKFYYLNGERKERDLFES